MTSAAPVAAIALFAALMAWLVAQDRVFDSAPAQPKAMAQVAKATAKPVAKQVAKKTVANAKPVKKGPTAFQLEQAMSHRELMARWTPLITEASKRFGVPVSWIRAVMQAESGGRTQLVEGKPITSRVGAMGLMQLMPETYAEMRSQYDLGKDPFDPHDNIIAGTAYLRWLRGKYGYPTMFAAYNDGPGNLEARLRGDGMLPVETQLYLVNVTAAAEGRSSSGGGGKVLLTQPNGSPVSINVFAIRAVRAALPDEYAPGVRTVITVGRVKQGVKEGLAQAKSIIRSRGGAI